MMFKLFLRMIFKTTPRILFKFIFNFGIKSVIGLNKFKKRIKNGESFPAFLMISITSKCNLECQGCWVSSKHDFEIPIEKLDEVISQSKKKGSYYFGILGGEPLLYKNLFDIIKNHTDCYFQIFTNGTLITDEIAKTMFKLGNVSPLISIEGLENTSNTRRGSINVFNNSLRGLKYCIENKLITGVSTSVCRSNFNELVNEDFIKKLIDIGVLYIWYYIYRPVGVNPHRELILTMEEIISLRKFIVEARVKYPVIIVDTYWDDKGKALCPAATGISHHINPAGYVEFCPPIQFACDNINGYNDMNDLFNNSGFIKNFKKFASALTDGCILMENPQRLLEFIKKEKAKDTTGRNSGYKELKKMTPCICHNLKGYEIPEKSFMYKFAKKNSFFGFGAYG